MINSIWKYNSKLSWKTWSTALTSMPKNIYNFAIRYINKSLPDATNIHKWGITPSLLSIHCNNAQTLGHLISGCIDAFNEKFYNYRHDSILENFFKALETINRIEMFAYIMLKLIRSFFFSFICIKSLVHFKVNDIVNIPTKASS